MQYRVYKCILHSQLKTKSCIAIDISVNSYLFIRAYWTVLVLLQVLDIREGFYNVVGRVIPIASLLDHTKVMLLCSRGEEWDKSVKTSLLVLYTMKTCCPRFYNSGEAWNKSEWYAGPSDTWCCQICLCLLVWWTGISSWINPFNLKEGVK